MELQRCGLHDMNSHANDGSKYLTYDQIISVSDAVVATPAVSGAVLRRNMLMHDSLTKSNPAERTRSVQHRVYKVRKELTQKQLDGLVVSYSFGDLSSFTRRNVFSELLGRHNDPEDAYHLPLYDLVVIGGEVQAHHDVLRVNLSSPWMLANALSAIATGWGFQLNGDVTSK